MATDLRALPEEPRGRMRRGPRPTPVRQRRVSEQPVASPVTTGSSINLATAVLLFATCAGLGIWSYWPTFKQLAESWLRTPDYNYCFAVLPVAALFLWLRRASCPSLGTPNFALCLVFLMVAATLRLLGDFLFFSFLDGWSFIPWTAALAAALGGWPLLKWAAPAIGFLIFMIPLPFALENDLSGPLQRIATSVSSSLLQSLGRPAFPEGSEIVLGSETLRVADACCGLRLFMCFLALTYAYMTIVPHAWWEKLLLMAAVAPIAIFSNALRIVATALIYEATANPAIRQFVHDGAGLAEVPIATCLFLGLTAYLRALVHEEEIIDISAVVKHSHL
jgi:exosortase